MTHNNITGDKIATKAPTKAYRDGHDRIFAKKPEVSEHDRAVRVLQRIEEGKAKIEQLEKLVAQTGSFLHIPDCNK